MYTKNKPHLITIRLNEGQFEFLKKCSDNLSVSPSEFLRTVINSTMSMTNHKGRWKGAGLGDYYCSLCCTTYSGGDEFNYCPNCGAYMK